MEPKFCLDGYSHQSACLTSAVPVRGLIDKVLLMPPDATECYSSHQLEGRAVLTRNILDLLKFLLFSVLRMEARALHTKPPSWVYPEVSPT